ncbi:MAG: hypothetical protein KatS3mg029_0410 [Saprospiraceae bacterium]|nr:MAG: hypothetical protein KatS3mg029_0410 [Saprospiraceae bacterium]
MMTSIRRWLLLTFCFALAAGSLAQPPDSLHKPVRVGLVLSGGGAKGLAYIGMLKVLEEAGIQVDYIGGTSMGAIIGGLYASGWSARQLDSLVHTTDLWQVIQEDVPRGAKPFFEKVYGEKYALTFPLEGMRVALPAGLSNGQHVYDLLYRWTEHVNHIQDFHLLPIPFFCIATDAVNGQEVQLDCGSLPLAMRASGALPGLLAPVEVDGRLLTDGGIVNNFPAREVRERGMDYVIGLNVESSLFEQSELKSIERLIMQISLYQSDLRSKAQLKHCDVLIQPDMSGYGVTSFDARDSLIALGERTARQHWDQLVEIGRLQRAAGRQVRRSLPPPPDTYEVSEIVIPQQARLSKRYFQRLFSYGGSSQLVREDFYQRLERLYATGYFSFLYYDVAQQSGNCRHIRLRPALKSGFDRRLRLGVHYDAVYRSSVLINLTQLSVPGLRNATASLDLIFGDKVRYNFHLLMDGGAFPDLGFNSRLRYNTLEYLLPQPLRADSNLLLERLRINLIDVHNQFYVQLLRNNENAFGVYGALQFFKSSARDLQHYEGRAGLADEDAFYLDAGLFFIHDDRDHRDFAMDGCESRSPGSIPLPAQPARPPLAGPRILHTTWTCASRVLFRWAAACRLGPASMPASSRVPARNPGCTCWEATTATSSTTTAVSPACSSAATSAVPWAAVPPTCASTPCAASISPFRSMVPCCGATTGPQALSCSVNTTALPWPMESTPFWGPWSCWSPLAVKALPFISTLATGSEGRDA